MGKAAVSPRFPGVPAPSAQRDEHRRAAVFFIGLDARRRDELPENYDRASFSAEDGPEFARSEFEQTLPDRSPGESPKNRSHPDVTWRLTRPAPPARATAIGTEERWFRPQL